MKPLPAGAIGLDEAITEVAKRLGHKGYNGIFDEAAAWDWICGAVRDEKLPVYIRRGHGETIRAGADQFAALIGSIPNDSEALRGTGGDVVRGTAFIFLEHVDRAFADKSGTVSASNRKDAKKRTKRELIVVALRQKFQSGVPNGLTIKQLQRECGTEASERTFRRALVEYEEELNGVSGIADRAE